MLSLAIISTLVVFGKLYFLSGLFLYQTDGKVHHSLVPAPIYTAWGIIVLALFSIIPFLTTFERVGIINPADGREKITRFA